jgi:hypothetical protein
MIETQGLKPLRKLQFDETTIDVYTVVSPVLSPIIIDMVNGEHINISDSTLIPTTMKLTTLAVVS